MVQSPLPIKLAELLNLTNVGLKPESISFTTFTMESDTCVFVNKEVNGQLQIVTVEMSNPTEPNRVPITAESAIANPVSKAVALKAGSYLQIFNMETRSKIKSHQLTEPVLFWKWISTATVAFVTDNTVYHWSMEGQSEPVKVFDRHHTLNDTRIINYETSPDEKWMVLIGIKSEAGTNRIVGAMQLYSKDKKGGELIEGHSAAFTQFTVEGATAPSTLFTFAVKTAARAKLHCIEVSPGAKPLGVAGYGKKATDIYFPPEATQDFPVAMEVSSKYSVIYMVTKFGYMHVYDIETATLIYIYRISAETVCATAKHQQSGGIIGINRKGHVLCVTLDEANVVPYICNQLNNFGMALKLAVRNNLPGAEQLLGKQFNNLMNKQDYRGAAKLAAESPQQALRTLETIQRFQAAPAMPGQPSPMLTYFGMLLEKGKLNARESIELAKPVIQQAKHQLLQKWTSEDKLECTEELGDLVKMVDQQLALSIYLRASASAKVIQCFMETGQFEKIMLYCQKVNYTADWGFLLTNIVRVNPTGALEFAQKLVQADGVTLDYGVVADVFMQHNCLQQTTSLQLVEEVEKRNLLKLLQRWLEARVEEGVQEAAVHNALMKIYIDINNRPEEHLVTNLYYDSKVVGEYCESRDPQLAFVAYKRGMCDAELVDLTNRHSLFEQQARYLIERQNLDLWATVLTLDNENCRPLIDAVQNALPKTKNPELVSTIIQAFMTADLPNELIELLEKLVLRSSDFSDNCNLQNLLILTAIKADKARVMDYINRLSNYDMPNIANIAVGSKLYEEALVVFKKAGLHSEAATVFIDYIQSLERAKEFADCVNKEEVWVMLGMAQLAQSMLAEAIDSFVKAGFEEDYVAVIVAAKAAEQPKALVEYLTMCRNKREQAHIGTSIQELTQAVGLMVDYCAVVDVLAQLTCISSLVELLRNGPDAAKEKAAEAFVLLACLDDNKASIAAAGGIQPLVELTRSGSTVAKEKAVEALGNLALDADNQVAIAAAGGILPLVELACASSYGAQLKALETLRNLAVDMENKSAIAAAGGIEPLIKLVKNGSGAAQERAADVLWNMAVHDANKVAIATAGGIEPLVELARSGSSAAKENATGALQYLSVKTENWLRIEAAGGVDLLMGSAHVSVSVSTQEAADTLRDTCLDGGDDASLAADGMSSPLEMCDDNQAGVSATPQLKSLEKEAAKHDSDGWRVLDPALLALLHRLNLTFDAKSKLLRVILEHELHTLEAIAGADLTSFESDGYAELAIAQREILVGDKLLRVATTQLTFGELVGTGSFGSVYKVYFGDSALALKSLRLSGLSQSQQQDVLKSARREARVLQQLKHENVIDLVGMVIDDFGSIGLLMELSVLGSLRGRLDSTLPPLDEHAQLHIATGIAAGMAFLHSCQVLHHDLKSANVLLFEVDGKLTPKLADFGLSVALSSNTLSSRRGGAGSTAFKAPEQFDGEISTKSEVYAFGIILWELLHEPARVWEGKTEIAILGAVFRGLRPPVSAQLREGTLKKYMQYSWEQDPGDRPDFDHLFACLHAASRTFATSNFKKQYESMQSSSTQLITDEIIVSTRRLILDFAQQHNVSSSDAEEYFMSVRRAAFTASAHGHHGATAVNEMLNDPHLFAVRMYASALQVSPSCGRELCTILNKALREDHVEHAMPLVRALNKRLITRNQPLIRWPTSNTLWRGGALPEQHRHFYEVGKKYRVPMFLSSSVSRSIAQRFMMERGAPHYTLWEIRLDPIRHCVHVNHIDRHDLTLGVNPNVGPEDEYLFAPYSTFTVERVQWQEHPTSSKPHLVTISAAVDNRMEPEDLFLAPWA